MATTKKTTKAKEPKGPSFIKSFFSSEMTKFVVGLLILLLAAFLSLAYFSFFVTGKADQALIENLPARQILGTQNGIANWAGSFGAFAAEYCINRWIGVSAFLFVIVMFRLGYRLLKNISIRSLFSVFVRYALWSIWISAALGYVAAFIDLDSTFLYIGGHHGYDLSQVLKANFGWIGALLLLVVSFVLLCFSSYREKTVDNTRVVFGGWFKVPFSTLRKKVIKRQQEREKKRLEEEEAARKAQEEAERLAQEQAAVDNTELPQETPSDPTDSDEPILPSTTDILEPDLFGIDNEPVQPVSPLLPETDTEEPVAEDSDKTDIQTTIIAAPETEEAEAQWVPYDPTKDLEMYQFPSFDLLKQYAQNVPIDMEEQNENKEKIRQTLSDYGIEIKSITAMVGPTITLFEIVPETGTKISRVRNLQDELAMSIAAKSGVRIIAPIPGKSAIGIEVPNKDPQTVSMHSCITSKVFQESKMELPVALGKTITNEVFTFDLAKMPHLLVAGSTGQGKSVGLNAIITSLLYKKHPSQLKIVLVDPKQVEFSIYGKIDKHYLAKLADEPEPIITDVSRVVATLQSLCVEMEDRYALVKDAELRNIKEYNQKFINRELNPNKLVKAALGSRDGVHHHYMPYMVVIIDEYGDLIMTAGKEIELPIARIAQKARAVGIHMIIATQRPSTKIVTGIIKANFPARIAFRVASSIDSGIILDQSGAQNLIGRGDLLFSTGNAPVRVQCAFVDTPEVDAINKFIAQQQSYPTAFILPDPPVEGGGIDDGGQGGGVDLHQLDPMFNEAAELVVATGQGSTSMIQRKFAIGYNRAGRIMDQLEAAGIVGPYTGSKARAVLVDSESELQNILMDLKNN